MSDALSRFVLENTPVRGAFVRLDATYREVLSRHDYPPVLRTMLGELLAATALLASNLKFKGSVIVQLQSPGPLQLLVVECNDERGMRAIAKWNGPLDPDADLQDLAPAGRCVITLDPRDAARAEELLFRRRPSGEEWRCGCGERLGGQFTQCWKCGAYRNSGSE